MPEFVNTPNFYQDSDILSKINLPKKKEKKETKKHIKKKNNDFKKRVSSRHSFFLIESVHKITHFWTLSVIFIFNWHSFF